MLSEKAIISNNVSFGRNVTIWDFSTIREEVVIGNNVIIGKNVYIGPGVVIGNQVKIQNQALIYEPTIIGDGVFIGPGVIFTNDLNPRSINLVGKLKNEQEWQKVGVSVGEGASIGAGSICVAPVKIGNYSLIGAGSVVTKDVKDFALIVGNPGNQIGWVGKAGVKLISDENKFICPVTKEEYLYDKKIDGIYKI